MKRVDFRTVRNEDGESDIRMNMTEDEKQLLSPGSDEAKDAQSFDRLGKIIKAFGKMSDDHVHKNLNVNKIHIYMLRELHERRQNGKNVVLSDGNKEMIDRIYLDLRKMKRAEE